MFPLSTIDNNPMHGIVIVGNVTAAREADERCDDVGVATTKQRWPALHGAAKRTAGSLRSHRNVILVL